MYIMLHVSYAGFGIPSGFGSCIFIGIFLNGRNIGESMYVCECARATFSRACSDTSTSKETYEYIIGISAKTKQYNRTFWSISTTR